MIRRSIDPPFILFILFIAYFVYSVGQTLWFTLGSCQQLRRGFENEAFSSLFMYASDWFIPNNDLPEIDNQSLPDIEGDFPDCFAIFAVVWIGSLQVYIQRPMSDAHLGHVFSQSPTQWSIQESKNLESFVLPAYCLFKQLQQLRYHPTA